MKWPKKLEWQDLYFAFALVACVMVLQVSCGGREDDRRYDQLPSHRVDAGHVGYLYVYTIDAHDYVVLDPLGNGVALVHHAGCRNPKCK